MPRVSRCMVRSSLLFLAAGATLGACLKLEKALALDLGLYPLLPVHREMLLVGWLVQLAVGVAYWILPPLKGASVRERGALASLVLLNGGVVAVAATSFAEGDAWLMASGRAVEAAAVAVVGAAFVRGQLG